MTGDLESKRKVDRPKKQEKKNKVTKVNTFPVPFALTESKENIYISTNSPSKPSKEEIIKQAFHFHSQGNISEAAKYYQHFINQGFKDHRVFSNYGIILKQLGKLQDAKLSYQKAIKLKPNFANAHYNMGIILKDLGKLQDAEFSYRKAIELKPNFVNAYLNLGNILKNLGKSQEGEYLEKKGIDISLIENIDSKFKVDYLKNIKLSKSQFRQDLFALSELNFKKNGFFVEFGSCDGLNNSNSYLLENFFNWDGILAEPAIYWHNKLQENRSVNIETKCVWKSSDDELLFNEPSTRKQTASIDDFCKANKEYIKETKKYKVQTISLFDLLEKYQAPKTIDYLSIDTEGSEYEILKAFDFDKYKFRVITCEHNFSPIREKIYDLLMNKGYTRKSTNISRVDDWYIFAE